MSDPEHAVAPATSAVEVHGGGDADGELSDHDEDGGFGEYQQFAGGEEGSSGAAKGLPEADAAEDSAAAEGGGGGGGGGSGGGSGGAASDERPRLGLLGRLGGGAGAEGASQHVAPACRKRVAFPCERTRRAAPTPSLPPPPAALAERIVAMKLAQLEMDYAATHASGEARSSGGGGGGGAVPDEGMARALLEAEAEEEADRAFDEDDDLGEKRWDDFTDR
jgi:hypothetical protein